MYFFDKKVIYLVWKNGEGQARGVGTARFLAMDGVCRIEVSVTKCGNVQGTYPVYLMSGSITSLLGEITLSRGKGNFYLKCDTKSLGHNALPYTKVTGLLIDLKTEGTLEQKWLPITEEKEEKSEVKATPVREIAEVVPVQELPEVQSAQKEEPREEQMPVVEPQKELPPVAEVKKELPPVAKKPPEQQKMSIYPNKWQQLCAIYPIVHPFQDGRAYLSIEPRDFVLLQEQYQPLVQNSFLLHSFYHYKYLLLGRRTQGRTVQYYLGVPGVFYEKEKAAAIYYGFESFEGAVTPATEGSFGYYMKRVQI